MTTKTLTKTLAVALTAIVLSGSFVSSASATDQGFAVQPLKQKSRVDGRRTNAAIGIAAGIGGALLGAAILNAQPRYRVQTGYAPQPRGYGHVSYGSDRYDDEEECFEKPIRRVDHFTGRVIIVGSKVVCR